MTINLNHNHERCFWTAWKEVKVNSWRKTFFVTEVKSFLFNQKPESVVLKSWANVKLIRRCFDALQSICSIVAPFNRGSLSVATSKYYMSGQRCVLRLLQCEEPQTSPTQTLTQSTKALLHHVVLKQPMEKRDKTSTPLFKRFHPFMPILKSV